MDLSTSGNHLGSLAEGWSSPETWGVWTDASRAVLHLPVGGEARNLTLRFGVHAFLAEKHPSIAVTVQASGEDVGDWTFDLKSPDTDREIIIPDRLLTETALEIVFLIKNPMSPAELGISADPRKLGLGLREIRALN